MGDSSHEGFPHRGFLHDGGFPPWGIPRMGWAPLTLTHILYKGEEDADEEEGRDFVICQCQAIQGVHIDL